MSQKDPCELCIIKVICTVLCRDKVDQISVKILKRKKLKNPNQFLEISGVSLWDFIDELALEGKIMTRYDDETIEVKSGVIKGTAGGS